MVEKPKAKRKTDRNQRLFDARTVMHGHRLYPDTLNIDEEGWVVAEFEANNPQLPHAANALLIMEQNGYIWNDHPVLWADHGTKFRFHINETHLYPPTVVERIKRFLGLEWVQ